MIASDGREILLAAVADGAGSASRSEEGAQLAIRSFQSEFKTIAASDPSLSCVDRAKLTAWTERLRGEIAAIAEAGGNDASDYACTFLAAVVGPARAVFMQIGDGAIVVRDNDSGDYAWMFWPQHGEFANTTNFITQENYDTDLEVEIVDGHLAEVAIFSDGIERMVLDIAGRAVHSPALRPIFKWLATMDPDLPNVGAAPGLIAFLGSDGVNRRTDDDKTLVVATRAAAGAAA